MLTAIIDAVSPHLLTGGLMALIMGVMLLVHKLRAARHAPQDALEILKQRFARGEIDEQEFELRRKVLADAGSS